MKVTPPRSAVAAAHRKKAACTRSWLRVDSDGQAHAVEAGKHDIMCWTGLPARDLRILDPVLSYPSTVLGRERAIVVNLEHIRAIITAQEVLLLNSRDPLVTPFVQKLQDTVRHRQTAFKSPQEHGGGVISNNADLHNLEEPQQREQQAAENANSLMLLPFEFVALEVCLEAACSSLDNEAKALEQETYPALDKLTSKISTFNLEHVRQIKSRLVAITGRVQKVRDELEHLLDDDEDMAEMYLTDKLERQNLDNSSVSSLSEIDDLHEEQVHLPNEENRNSAEILARHEDSSALPVMHTPETDNLQREIIADPNSLRRDSHRTIISTRSTNTKQLDVEDLEMILEAYFVQIEGTLNKLSTLREYVDDTNDYINIMLDFKQNHLLQIGVMLSTATLVVSAFVALTGVFGMNIDIKLFNHDTAEQKHVGMVRFLWTSAGGTIGCVFMYVAAIAWYKHNKLLR